MYDAEASYPDIQECDGHLIPSKDYDAKDWNLFLIGGYVDGAGLVSCICLNSFKHFTMRDMSLRNGKKYGLRIEEEGSMWTYELVAQNLYVKCTMPGIGGNAGISSRGGGYCLLKEPEDCVVGDILQLTEGDLAPVSCLESCATPCERVENCKTLPMWKDFYKMVNQYFLELQLQIL